MLLFWQSTYNDKICKNKKMAKKSQEKNPSKSSWSSRAKWDEESLGTNVLDYGQQGKMNQFNKTFEAIISHIGRTYHQPGNVISSLRSGRKIDMADPAAPTVWASRAVLTTLATSAAPAAQAVWAVLCGQLQRHQLYGQLQRYWRHRHLEWHQRRG